jgi:hypothetical protein
MTGLGRSLFRFRIRTLLLVLILGLVSWSGYSYWTDYRQQAHRAARELLSPPLGAKCTVVFTHDALGLESGSAQATQIHGTDNYLRGRFALSNSEWIVLDPLEGLGPQQWISRKHVLLLLVESE